MFQWVFSFNKGNIPVSFSHCYNKRILTYEVFANLACFAWFAVQNGVFPGAETAFFLAGAIDEHIEKHIFMQS